MEIKDFEPSTVKAFINYIYTDIIDPETFDLSLIYIAHKYNVPRLVSECTSMLCDQMNGENILDIIKAGYYLDNETLFESAVNYMQRVHWIQKKKDEWNAFKSLHVHAEIVIKITEYLLATPK